MSDYYVPNLGSTPNATYTAKAAGTDMGKRNSNNNYANSSRNKTSQNHEEADMFDEKSDISINALILFIEDCISQKTKKNQYDQLNKESFLAPWMRKNHSNSNHNPMQSTQAANAYKHASQTNKLIPMRNEGSVIKDKNLNTLLELLEDLRILSANGVRTIGVDRAASFLDSVHDAIEKEKSDR